MDLSTTLSAISSAKDFATLLIGRKIDAAVTEKAIELQNSIIALQSGLLEMQATIQMLKQQNSELQNALAAAKQWQGQEDSHDLATIAQGVHVYVSSELDPVDETTPWYCANCWQRQFKSVLQRTAQDYRGTYYYCPNCNAKVYDHSDPAEYG
jgi:DNA-directed RNA polymerase subunit RPC12/RpoP